MKATADQAASDAEKKADTAGNIVLGGLGVGLAGVVLGASGTALLLAAGLCFAGGSVIFVGDARLLKALTDEICSKAVSTWTADWAQLMADESKTQATPAPAQPAPAAAPDQQQPPAPASACLRKSLPRHAAHGGGLVCGLTATLPPRSTT